MLNNIQKLFPFARTIKFYDQETNTKIARGNQELFDLLSRIDTLSYKGLVSKERTDRFKSHIDEILEKGINVYNHDFDYHHCYNILGFGNVAGYSYFTAELINNDIIVRYVTYINQNGETETIEGSLFNIKDDIPWDGVKTFFKFKKPA